jgi:formylglycine-generating enzyme required for sulfatase activity
MRKAALMMILLAAAIGVGADAQDAKPWERQGTKAGEEIVGPDGGKMIWVPAGGFDMGSEDCAVLVHTVQISKGFWLGKCTVTNAQYRQYCQASKTEFPTQSDQGDDHPVIYVSWDDAKKYCHRFGLQLPTEAQWEYAARGPEGRKYPWGDNWDKSKCCNDANKGPKGQTFPVGSFPQGASWCGALDMAGNVWQWCSDWYDGEYYARSPAGDPPGPDTGLDRVLRGGGWTCDADHCRSAFRYDFDPEHGYVTVGFRCAKIP